MHNVTVATILTIVVVFVLCSMFLYWKWRKRAKCFKQNIFESSKQEINGNKREPLPTLSITTDYSCGYIRNPEIDCVESREDVEKLTTLNEVRTKMDHLQPNKRNMFNKNEVEIKEEIGKGNFGKVYKGEVIGLLRPDSKTTVAIKSVSGMASKREIDDFLEEIKVMSHLKHHLNIAGMIGACTSETTAPQGDIWLVLEFCKYGDLKKYLMKHKNKILNGKESDLINNRCLVKWAHDVANGMKFLAENQIMHGDLAARNILMDGDGLPGNAPIAKVADFGLSKRFYDNVSYHKASRMFVPWKWMAYEYLTRDIFTITSDVWSFGVLLWEIFSFGRTPYGHRGYDEVLDFLQQGNCLDCPKEVEKIKSWEPKQLFESISKSCFERDCLKRIPFSAIVQIIQEELSNEEMLYYIYRSSQIQH